MLVARGRGAVGARPALGSLYILASKAPPQRSRLCAPFQTLAGSGLKHVAQRSSLAVPAVAITTAVTLHLSSQPPALCLKVAAPDAEASVSTEPTVLAKQPRLVRILKLLWRFGELSLCLGPMLFWYAVRKIPLAGKRWVSRQQLFDRFVRALAQCGPVGIKWGQWASTRYDLFEDDFCETIGTLTNMAPSHSYSCTKEAVERSFGQPIDAIFECFDAEPLASGSIGQVHAPSTQPGHADAAPMRERETRGGAHRRVAHGRVHAVATRHT